MSKSKFIDLTGMVFGKLTVLKRDFSKTNKVYWWCQCSCKDKTIKSILANCLKKGNTKSCGCIRKETLKETHKNNKKLNLYNLTGEYGIGYTSNTNEEFYFDLEDYNKIKDYCWRIDNSETRNKGYISSIFLNNLGNRKNIKMHRLIMDVIDPKIQVDHIHHVRYDNRKDQLRIVDNSQNCMNRKIRKDNTSGVPGVCWQKNEGCWRVQIQINKVRTYIGKFTDFEEAVRVRKKAEEKYYREYSYDNSMNFNKDNPITQ